MELTIHIGPHKTGTTAIQAAFSQSAAALRRQGVYYPKRHWRQKAHHRLAFALKGKKMPGGDAPDLSAELEALCHTLSEAEGAKVLISSEEFFTCPREGVARLRDAIAGPVRIICFLRRPDDFLVSCYNQKIKQPGNGFAAPIARYLKAPRTIAPEMDYLGAVSTWADVFGNAAMAVEVYEDGPPLARLRHHLGLNGQPAEPPCALNASVPGAVAEIMRHAKAAGLCEGKQRKLLVRARQVYDGYPAFYVSDEDRRAVIAAMEEDLNTLFARFGKDNPYTLAAFTGAPPTTDHNLNMREMMQLLDGYL